jgi:NRAMP (natural resistance-associated macrophage protein)-like metal ion transporter
VVGASEEPTSSVVGPSKPRLWRALGPGLISGASDDDPSGIATYSQAGAQFGYAMGWTLLLTYPLMVVVQSMSARIGRTTGRGIAGNLREHYPNWLLQSIVALLFVANTLNVGADLSAMAEATRLVWSSCPSWVLVIFFGGICAGGQIFLEHTRYVAALKWLTLSLFSYFAVIAVVHVPWSEVAHGLLIPRFSQHRDFWMMAVAILGTTISPYLFFWQAAQEVEDTKANPRRAPLRRKPKQATNALARIQIDTLVGMAFSNLVGLAILVTASVTLHAAGHSEIESAAQAAEALRPVAGDFAFALFALGIVGTGLLSVPVLAGSAAYALGEARRWPVGLARRPLDAKAFYAAIVVATFLGASLTTTSVNAVKALVWVAVLNAFVAVPVMGLLTLMTRNKRIMGRFVVARHWSALGWLTTALMAAAGAIFLWSTLH